MHAKLHVPVSVFSHPPRDEQQARCAGTNKNQMALLEDTLKTNTQCPLAMCSVRHNIVTQNQSFCCARGRCPLQLALLGGAQRGGAGLL